MPRWSYARDGMQDNPFGAYRDLGLRRHVYHGHLLYALNPSGILGGLLYTGRQSLELRRAFI